MTASLLLGQAPFLVPEEGPGPLDRTVAANFERYNGLEQLDNAPSWVDPSDFGAGLPPSFSQVGGGYPRPGAVPNPAATTYTRGPLSGLTNTTGGQPLPVAGWEYRPPGNYTPANWAQTMQSRFGHGTNFQGVAQTVQLADVTNNPPVPDQLSEILFSYG